MPDDTDKQRSGLLLTAGLAGVGALGAIAAAPIVVGAVGFGAGGIAAGSTAAGMMSSAALANGGCVATGSIVAVLQSVGAAGLGLKGAALVGSAGAVTTTALSRAPDVVSGLKDAATPPTQSQDVLSQTTQGARSLQGYIPSMTSVADFGNRVKATTWDNLPAAPAIGDVTNKATSAASTLWGGLGHGVSYVHTAAKEKWNSKR